MSAGGTKHLAGRPIFWRRAAGRVLPVRPRRRKARGGWQRHAGSEGRQERVEAPSSERRGLPARRRRAALNAKLEERALNAEGGDSATALDATCQGRWRERGRAEQQPQHSGNWWTTTGHLSAGRNERGSPCEQRQDYTTNYIIPVIIASAPLLGARPRSTDNIIPLSNSSYCTTSRMQFACGAAERGARP